MELKMIILVKKRPGLSDEEFRSHYENGHVPLVARLLPKPLSYRRHFVVKQDPFLLEMTGSRGSNEDDDIEAITEVTYSSRADAEKMLDVMRNTEAGQQIMDDEAKFCDRDKLRFYVVETPPE